jgi:hypothetical protein
VTGALLATPAKDAVTVTVWSAVTEAAVAAAVALLAPAGTVICGGNGSTEELLASDTMTPPVGAAPANETTQFVAAPAATLAGLHEIPDSTVAAGRMVREVDFELVPSVADSETTCWEVTVAAEALNVAAASPDGMETEAGTVAAGALLWKE